MFWQDLCERHEKGVLHDHQRALQKLGQYKKKKMTATVNSSETSHVEQLEQRILKVSCSLGCFITNNRFAACLKADRLVEPLRLRTPPQISRKKGVAVEDTGSCVLCSDWLLRGKHRIRFCVLSPTKWLAKILSVKIFVDTAGVLPSVGSQLVCTEDTAWDPTLNWIEDDTPLTCDLCFPCSKRAKYPTWRTATTFHCIVFRWRRSSFTRIWKRCIMHSTKWCTKRQKGMPRWESKALMCAKSTQRHVCAIVDVHNKNLKILPFAVGRRMAQNEISFQKKSVRCVVVPLRFHLQF